MTWICFLAGLALLAIALGIAQHHLGTYMARVFTSDKDTRVETWCYRVMGVNPRAGQTWKSYARAVLASVSAESSSSTLCNVSSHGCHGPWGRDQ